MRTGAAVKSFNDRYPLLGPSIWILCVQYFAVQITAAAAWTHRFSLNSNPISDLGNTACDLYAGRYVCSPLHALMNASFIMLGATMALGSLLIYQEFKESRASLIGFSCLALGGFGTILVGLFPENTIKLMHAAGAGLPFLVGNIGIIILAFALPLRRPLRAYSFVTGVITLLALGLFMTHTYLGLGEGGMERIVAYPQTIWLIIFGIYMSGNRFYQRHSKI